MALPGLDPITQALSDLHSAGIAEREAQLKLEKAQRSKAELGQTAFPRVVAALEKQRTDEAKQREQIQKAGESGQQQVAQAAVPPPVQPTGDPAQGGGLEKVVEAAATIQGQPISGGGPQPAASGNARSVTTQGQVGPEEPLGRRVGRALLNIPASRAQLGEAVFPSPGRTSTTEVFPSESQRDAQLVQAAEEEAGDLSVIFRAMQDEPDLQRRQQLGNVLGDTVRNIQERRGPEVAQEASRRMVLQAMEARQKETAALREKLLSGDLIEQRQIRFEERRTGRQGAQEELGELRAESLIGIFERAGGGEAGQRALLDELQRMSVQDRIRRDVMQSVEEERQRREEGEAEPASPQTTRGDRGFERLRQIRESRP